MTTRIYNRRQARLDRAIRKNNRRLLALFVTTTATAFAAGFLAFVSANANQNLVLSVWANGVEKLYIMETGKTPNACEKLRAQWESTLDSGDYVFCETESK